MSQGKAIDQDNFRDSYLEWSGMDLDIKVGLQDNNPFSCAACHDYRTGQPKPKSAHTDGNMKLYNVKFSQIQDHFRESYTQDWWLKGRPKMRTYMTGIDLLYPSRTTVSRVII